MKKLGFIFVFLCLIFSCYKSEVDSPILVYKMESNEPENYLVNVKEDAYKINYKYISRENPAIQLDFNYTKENNNLVLNLDTLKVIKSTFKPNNTEFKMYQTKQKRSHIKTYVFNKDYGLFASLDFKSHQLFLKDSLTFIEKETIFKGLFIELNKLQIQ